MIIASYNIPGHLRFKGRFSLVTGFVPGRMKLSHCDKKGVAKPQDRMSFFRPLIDELKILDEGVSCYDSIERTTFKLRGHLCVVATDMVERADLLAFYGHKGKVFCEYCRMVGLKAGGVYTPITAPRNASRAMKRREIRFRQQRRPYFDFSAEGDEERRPENLPALARTGAHIRRCLSYIREHPDHRHFQKLHGIKGISIFFELRTITIPFSFPPDIMHLSCNVAKLMVEVYNGTSFQKTNREEYGEVDPESGAATESSDDADEEDVNASDGSDDPEVPVDFILPKVF